MIYYQFRSSEWPILFIITFLFLILIWKKIKSSPKLPPGPWRLPIIGSMHHLMGCVPHHKMRDLASKYGPIMRLQFGELPTIVISTAEAAKLVLKTHDLSFAQRPHVLAAKSITYDYIDISFAPYGEYWRNLRKICTMELLTAKRVQSFKSIREEETSNMVRSVFDKAGSTINFARLMNSLTYSITSRAVFGKIWEGEDRFLLSLEKIIMEFGNGVSIADAYPSKKWLQRFSGTRVRVDKYQKEIDRVIQSILDEHRSARKRQLAKTSTTGSANQQEDFVDVLLNLQDRKDPEFPLTDEILKAVIMDMFAAGVDTAAVASEWIMYELMKNPDGMEKSQAEVRRIFDAKGRIDEEDMDELQYLKLVIKEGMRLHPPAPLLMPRECREKCFLNGCEIPLKSKLIVNAWAIQRDPKYWIEPDRFIPERFLDSSIDYKGNNFEFIPFGAGRKMCPAISFGISTVELPLAKLLCHFDWKLPDGSNAENLDLCEVGGSTSRKFPLTLIPTPYLSVS